MAQILQIKRTNSLVTDAVNPLAQFGAGETQEKIAQGEMFYANAGVNGVAGADEGVLYIGTELSAGTGADAIGGKAFTKMLVPATADTNTKIEQSTATSSAAGNAASISLADGQDTDNQKTITLSAPAEATDASLVLPASAGDVSAASTVVTTAGDARVAGTLNVTNLNITGNLEVDSGQLTTIETTDVAVKDKTMVLGVAGGMEEATYAQATNVLTVTSSNHGLAAPNAGVSEYVYISGAGSTDDGVYEVLTRADANTFTIQATASATVASGTAIFHSSDNVTAATASGSGIVVPTATGTSAGKAKNASILYQQNTDDWGFNSSIDIASGSGLKLNNVEVLSADTDLPVSHGGTGASDAAGARSNLDVDVAGTDNSTDVTLANTNYLTINGQAITGGTVPVASGGTGAVTAGDARTALGVDVAGTDNSTDVTLANTNYLTISGQAITGETVPVGSGGTGTTSLTDGGILLGSGTGAVSATAVLENGEMLVGDGSGDPAIESGATLRTSIGVDAAGTDNSTNVTLVADNDNYASISGQAITLNTVPIEKGGTGAVTAGDARTALDVDVAGTDNSTDVTLANTNYLTINGQAITGGTVPVGSGGTGATTAVAARTALDVDVAGTDNSTDVTLANNNYLTINGQAITGGTVPVGSGGTGATTVGDARTALDVDQKGNVVLASGDVTITPGSTNGTADDVIISNIGGTITFSAAGITAQGGSHSLNGFTADGGIL